VAPACGKDVKIIEVDACGLQCPGPIMKVSEGIKSIREGECLKVRATDPAFASDIRIWCERTGNPLLGVEREGSTYSVTIRKGTAAPAAPAAGGNGKSMVVFSGDLDKALAALIIANGAASMGRKVTLFFTFWGLNILRRNEHVPVKKNFIEKMFGMMMPRGSKKLGLSKMNMLGMGPKMIRSVMKSKNVSSLEELLRSAIDNGVRIVACQMSMDIMGIKREELIDGVEIAGVATFLGSAEQSDTNLFI
jgi:peroxiredoxin family protein/TusA-related sulfurtransferase